MNGADEKISEVVSLIETSCLNSPIGRLGTEISTELKEKMPDIDFKQRFGGIRRFIDSYCSNIRVSGKSGMDYVYSHARYLNESFTPVHDRDVHVSPWKVFTYPFSEYRLFFNPQDNSLVIIEPSTDIGEGLVEISKVTEDEYRQIAADFLKHESPIEAESLRQVIVQPNFWMPFTNAIKESLGYEGFGKLISWRLERLKEIFRERLSSKGIDQDKITEVFRYLNKVRKGRPNHLKPATTAINQARLERPGYSSPRLRNKHILSESVPIQLRKIIHACVENMSEEQLRQIWLPVGMVMDFARSRQ
jgi:hypothetical protein